MLLDVIILPPGNIRKKVAAHIKPIVRGIPTRFVVDDRKLIPHMSLFHLRTVKKRLPEIERIVSDIARRHKPFTVRAKSFGFWGDRALGWELSKNKASENLNRDVVQGCYKLRTGTMPWTPQRKPKKWEQENRRKYGTQHNIGKSYHPHFTMAYLKNPDHGRRVLDRVKAIKFDFLADTVAICEVSYWHQVTKILKKFKLT